MIVQSETKERKFFISRLLDRPVPLWLGNAGVFLGFAFFISVYGPLSWLLQHGYPLFDLTIAASPNYIHTTLTAMGSEGRSVYYHLEMIDMLAPVFYGPGIFLSLLYVLQAWTKPGSSVRLLAFAPLVAGILDWMENISILRLLAIYPERNLLELLLGFITTTKLVLVFGPTLVVFIGLVILWWRRRQKL
jgi:hypothetical protein